MPRIHWPFPNVMQPCVLAREATLTNAGPCSRRSGWHVAPEVNAFTVTLAPEFQARAFSLDLQRALGSVDYGSAQAECFFGEASPAALLLLPDPAATFDFLPNPAVKKLGYATAAITHSTGHPPS